MNWLKKLFNQMEEEKRIENKVEQEKGTSGKNPQAKVAYQYPTGKFRFPLIPDEEQQKSTPKRVKKEKPDKRPQPEVRDKKEESSATRINDAPPKKKEPGTKWQQKKQFEKITKVDSQPFHPTEVPSPIYGNNPRPPKKTERYLPETELLQEVGEFQTEQVESKHIDQLHEVEEIHVTEEIHATEEVHVIQEVEEVNSVDEVETRSSEGPLEESRFHQEEPIEQENYPSADKEAAATVQVVEDEVHLEEPKEQARRKRQHVPFNVIMLKQDKRSLERKRQQESESARLSTSVYAESESEEISTPVNQTEQTLHVEDEAQPFYQKPALHFLTQPPQHSEDDREWVVQQKNLLDETLHHFRVGARVVKATQGPSVTQFEVQPEPGVKVNKITNLSDDIKLSLSARDIRMEAPIPGKNTIGIEVPNRVSKPVFIREIIQHASFIQNSSPLTVAMGLDISGSPVVLDLQKMPHGLIAGATGSGKSVCVNSIIMSLLYKSSPDEVKLLLIDPKMVELTPYNHIPHLVSPVITDVKAATAALKWAVEEMERRYELFVHAGVRDIGKFNELAKKHRQETLPYMVIIIDELADLMMVAPSDVEEAICRIAQKARACGMHLLIATQRPSVDVITGLIKANIPTRIAFSVSSQVDSRTIIDIGGAERLLGRGDMLLLENGAPKPIRVQGNFVSDEEIELAVSHVRKEQKPNYLFEQSELLKENAIAEEEDELFVEACQFVIEQNGASTSSLQRKFRIGYNRAARLMEMMENQGVISGSKGSKPRDILVSEEDFMEWKEADN